MRRHRPAAAAFSYRVGMKESAFIRTPSALRDFCKYLRTVDRVAFDTEFVPEYTYAPVLCLIQVATDDELAVVDPLELDDLRPFWKAILRDDCECVLHAGKEELFFCQNLGRRLPGELFDTQIVAGLTGFGYPISHSNLMRKVANEKPSGSQTRTDWRQRPLSEGQLEYALDDVRWLLRVRDELADKLDELDRWDWYDEELDHVTERVGFDRGTVRYWRISGAGALSERGLTVLKSLAEWRDRKARDLDRPIKWVMRDDVLTDIAKRAPRNRSELQQTRGIGKAADSGWSEELLEAIAEGGQSDIVTAPSKPRRSNSPDEQMAMKILSAGMTHLATSNHVGPTMLGNADDLKELTDWLLAGKPAGPRPKLATGWRAEVCGDYLDDLLHGQTAVRLEVAGGSPRLVFMEQEAPPRESGKPKGRKRSRR